MPLEIKENMAVFSGHAAITEAETLLEWLRQEEEPLVDVRECRSAHAAVLQVLMALRPKIETGIPNDVPACKDWRALLCAAPSRQTEAR